MINKIQPQIGLLQKMAIFLTPLSCAVLSFSWSSAQISLDAHYHYSPKESIKGNPGNIIVEPDPYEISDPGLDPIAFMNRHKIDRSLLISDSYSAWKKREYYDIQTSKLAEMFPQRLKGLCGFQFDQEGALEHLHWCLRLPQMVGLKIHMTSYRSNPKVLPKGEAQHDHAGVCLSEDSTYQVQLKQLANSIEQLRPILLIHLVPSCEDQLAEAQFIFNFAKDHPQISLILAHSFSLEGIEHLGQLLSLWSVYNPKINNIFVDISAIETTNLYYPTDETVVPTDGDSVIQMSGLSRFANAWRNLGLSQVLIGTDNFNPYEACPAVVDSSICSPVTARSIFDIVTKESRFSFSEQYQLLYENGIKFWVQHTK